MDAGETLTAWKTVLFQVRSLVIAAIQPGHARWEGILSGLLRRLRLLATTVTVTASGLQPPAFRLSVSLQMIGK
ncbi:MAG: hypothetical protein ACE5G9_02110 [Nitrospinales bacterium]